MAAVALGADWMAAVHTVSDKRLARARCHRLLTEHFDLEEARIDEMLEQVSGNAVAAATALGVDITEQPPYGEIVTSADKRATPWATPPCRPWPAYSRATCHSSDVAARLGGDEVCLLLPETDAAGGQLTAERIRKQINAVVLRNGDSQAAMTGLLRRLHWRLGDFDKSRLRAVMKTINVQQLIKAIMEAADQALYRSKQGGRNTVNWTALEQG